MKLHELKAHLAIQEETRKTVASAVIVDDAETEGEEEYADDDTSQDLYNALNLLGTTMDLYETILSVDERTKGLPKNLRRDLESHLGDVVVFLEQFTNPNTGDFCNG